MIPAGRLRELWAGKKTIFLCFSTELMISNTPNLEIIDCALKKNTNFEIFQMHSIKFALFDHTDTIFH